MIHFINEDLFSLKFSNDRSHDFPLPNHMEVCSANELLRQKENSTGEESGSANMEKFVPIIRHIMNVHSFDNDFINHPMSMRVNSNIVSANVATGKDGTPAGTVTSTRKSITVDVRCLNDGEDNRVNLYLVAFPFNGLLVPIPEDPKYRIYKGTLVSSKKPFWWHGRKYRKTVYFVIEPNLRLFDPNHKHHTDKIDLTFEAMGIYTDKRDNDKQKTNHETMCISIVDREGNFAVTHDHEVIEEPVNLDPLTSESLWKTFEFEPRDRRYPDKSRVGYQGKSRSSFDRGANPRPNDGYRDNYSPKRDQPQARPDETKTIVTTNKHGIRKEVTVPAYRNKKPNKGSGGPKEKSELDTMIEKAGLISSREFRENQSFKPKRNRKGGKNPKGKR